ncbi:MULTISPECIES: hypothetical protein [unclassified Curtobacterium]|nr:MULTISPECIES: hypothetical protein [unclassified Curtobacterium]
MPAAAQRAPRTPRTPGGRWWGLQVMADAADLVTVRHTRRQIVDVEGD